MAQKKIKLELTVAEAQHLRAAIHLGQTDHEDSHGRQNRQLTSVMKKLDAATTRAVEDERAAE